MADMIFDDDVELAPIQGRRVAIVGYGEQARTHALNLRESGVSVVVGLSGEDEAARADAEDEGLRVLPVEEAVKDADLVALLSDAESLPGLYDSQIAGHLKDEAALVVSDPFSVRHQAIKVEQGHDVVMVQLKASGAQGRTRYESGSGAPALVAVAQDASGQAWELALAYAKALGATRAGVLKVDFNQASDARDFALGAIIGGGLARLVEYGYETLVEAGYPAELAYFETVLSLGEVAQTISAGGIEAARAAGGAPGEYGQYVNGAQVVTEETKDRMGEVLGEITDGSVAWRYLADRDNGGEELEKWRAERQEHPLAEVGRRLREELGEGRG